MQNGAGGGNECAEGADVARTIGEAMPLSQSPALDVCGHSLMRRLATAYCADLSQPVAEEDCRGFVPADRRRCRRYGRWPLWLQCGWAVARPLLEVPAAQVFDQRWRLAENETKGNIRRILVMIATFAVDRR